VNQVGVVLFHTTSAALRAEKLALEARCKVKLVPTPREFSSDCGLALRFAWGQRAKLERLLTEAEVETAAWQEWSEG
jgi:hypothetical protein